ncbi:GGDEF domain-containing protein [Undibacterium seohonense]|uniref:diguanylate cyclase n=1 Tax=Undibacterium seohonense TaxID=1344950 RepID=A0ABR6X398_9BURK|nr:GGDEF domain-containing protein [Undibacterium seohonense]MBC3807282.1 GGDEF domain-containing protein [Undibacterium seohonense]
MPKHTQTTIPFAQQQLLEAIAQIKEGSGREDVLPKLEAVMAQLQTLVTHDHLTGAFNRKTLIERLESELQRSQRTGHTFTVAMIGVDALPEVMEQHGQDVAKRILQVLTAEALLVLRSLDTFGRIEATEFAIIMPTTWLDQSLTAINRLKVRLQEFNWGELADNLQVSFCTGLTTNAAGDSADQLLARAQQALQQARLQGHNSVVQIEPELPGF